MLSVRFSVMDSYAADRMCSASSFAVSRETISFTRSRPASTPFSRAATTPSACSSSERHAKQHFNRNGAPIRKTSHGAYVPNRKNGRAKRQAVTSQKKIPAARWTRGEYRAGLAPPADEPAQKRDRVVRRVRITNKPVDGKREEENCAGKDQVCRYHTNSAPTIRTMNAAMLRNSILV